MRNDLTTPVMRQYLSIKEAHRDYLLFYRMGDFFELFFEDAILAAKELDIALTKRGKHNNQDIPMCGVPVHSSEVYLHRLIKKGYSVAICEQLESPEEAKKRGSKAVVKREVVRIITPGTLLEDSLLEAKEQNYLCCIAKLRDQVALCWVEISLGEFCIETVSLKALEWELARLAPKELLISDQLIKDPLFSNKISKDSVLFTIRADSMFDTTRCENKLKQFFQVKFLAGINDLNEVETIAAGALVEYIEYTQKNAMPKFRKLNKLNHTCFVAIDKSTRINLEIDKGAYSLSSVLDCTLTAAGGRLFHSYISSPLTDPLAINKRLDNVASLYKEPELCKEIRNLLKQFTDIERASSRIGASRGKPFDLCIISNGLRLSMQIAKIMHSASHKISLGLLSIAKQINSFDGLMEELKMALNPHIGVETELQYFFKRGYSPELDRLHDLKSNFEDHIQELKDKYKQITGVTNLKISKNNILGYFIEVTPTNSNKMQNEAFIHRQSLGSAIRYSTSELRQLEIEILVSNDRIIQLLDIIFKHLCQKVLESADQIALTSQSIAAIDVICAFAHIATTYNYVRPVVDRSNNLKIIDGRHPVVERKVKNSYVPNSCEMDKNSNLWLITGPNMAGKSTFLRQNALICIMAQIGSFVPAKSAHIGIIDRLYSRIGASDNIAQGQSTFMIEMLETAYIMNNATSQSLIILDEIGRGTATYDGLAIAWAVIEAIHNDISARTMFATHYHELTTLEQQLSKLRCYTIKVQEWEGKIVFLHEVKAGKASKSYGIHVAALAGMPESITDRAQQILETLGEKKID